MPSPIPLALFLSDNFLHDDKNRTIASIVHSMLTIGSHHENPAKLDLKKNFVSRIAPAGVFRHSWLAENFLQTRTTMKQRLYYLTQSVQRRDGVMIRAGTVLKLAGGASPETGHFFMLDQHQGMVISVGELARKPAPGLWIEDGLVLLDPAGVVEDAAANRDDDTTGPVAMEGQVEWSKAKLTAAAITVKGVTTTIGNEALRLVGNEMTAWIEAKKEEYALDAIRADVAAEANGTLPADARYAVMLHDQDPLKLGDVVRVALDESYLMHDDAVVVRALGEGVPTYVTVRLENTLACDKDGWIVVPDIEVGPPVDRDMKILVRYLGGSETSTPVAAKRYDWNYALDNHARIVAFRIAKPEPESTVSDQAFEAAVAEEQAFVMLETANEHLRRGQIVYKGEPIGFGDETHASVEVRDPNNGVIYANANVAHVLMAPCDKDGWVSIDASDNPPDHLSMFAMIWTRDKAGRVSSRAYQAEYISWDSDDIAAFRIEPAIVTKHENINNQGAAETGPKTEAANRAAEDEKLSDRLSEVLDEEKAADDDAIAGMRDALQETDDAMKDIAEKFAASIEKTFAVAREKEIRNIAAHMLPTIVKDYAQFRDKAELVRISFSYAEAWMDESDARMKKIMEPTKD